MRSVFVFLVIATAFGVSAVPRAADTPVAAPVVFDLPGLSDATPSIAAHEAIVAVAWGASAARKADVFVAVSRDAGRTFAAPVRVNRVPGEGRLGGELPPRVAIHQPTGTSTPVITVLWTARGAATEIKVARSTDGGHTFGVPVALQSAGAAGDRGWPALTVDGRGVAHAVWLDHRGLAAARAGAGHHQHATSAAAAVDGSVMAQRSALYYAAVGATATAERAVTPGVCYCCKTAIAAGADGTVFAAWRHVYAGDFRDMAMAVSRDGGRTFSSPARISEDGWSINGCPDDGPAVVVDGRGTAHVVWPTVIPGDSPEGALFYASTADGVRFTPRVRIPTLGSPKPMHPQLTRSRDGQLVVAWDEVIDGARVAAARTINVEGTTPAFGPVTPLAATGAATFPVLAAASDSLVAAWSTGGDSSIVIVRRLPMP